MKKQGGLMDVITFSIIAFAVITLIGLGIYASGVITEELKNVNILLFPNASGDPGFNFSDTIETVVEPVNRGVGYLKYLGILVVFGMMLTIIVTNFMVKSHPALAFLSMFGMTLIGVIIAVPMSNAYEGFLSDGTIGTTFQTFTGMNYIMDKLPIIVGIIGLLGLLFLAIGITRDSEAGGGIR